MTIDTFKNMYSDIDKVRIIKKTKKLIVALEVYVKSAKEVKNKYKRKFKHHIKDFVGLYGLLQLLSCIYLNIDSGRKAYTTDSFIAV